VEAVHRGLLDADRVHELDRRIGEVGHLGRGTPSGSDRPKPGVSGAITVKWSLQRSHRREHVARGQRALVEHQITTGPEPARR
jgi:hypothetical protein